MRCCKCKRKKEFIKEIQRNKKELKKIEKKLKKELLAKKEDKNMPWWGILLIVIGCVAVGLFLLTFIMYMFNLDMKLMAAMEPIFLKHYDKVERDEHL